MKKNLTRALAAALTVGLLTVNACALTPAITYPCHANSPFVPDFPFPPPPPPSIDTPFVPDCCFPDLAARIADVPAEYEAQVIVLPAK